MLPLVAGAGGPARAPIDPGPQPEIDRGTDFAALLDGADGAAAPEAPSVTNPEADDTDDPADVNPFVGMAWNLLFPEPLVHRVAGRGDGASEEAAPAGPTSATASSDETSTGQQAVFSAVDVLPDAAHAFETAPAWVLGTPAPIAPPPETVLPVTIDSSASPGPAGEAASAAAAVRPDLTHVPSEPSPDRGLRIADDGLQTADIGPKIADPGLRIADSKSRIDELIAPHEAAGERPDSGSHSVRARGSAAHQLSRAIERLQPALSMHPSTGAEPHRSLEGPSSFAALRRIDADAVEPPSHADPHAGGGRDSLPPIATVAFARDLLADLQPAASDAEAAAVDVGNPDGPDADTARHLLQSIRLQFQSGIGSAVFRLKPEHLGEVSVSLRVEQQAVVATIAAETPAVRHWLESEEAHLRQSLAQHGLNLDRLVVTDDDTRGRREPHQERQSPRRQSREAAPRSQDETPRFEIVV